MRFDNFQNNVNNRGECATLEFADHALLLQDLLALNAQLQALENPGSQKGAPGSR